MVGLSFGGDVSDDRLGKPDHKFFQLTVLVLKTIENLLQLNVAIGFIETMRPCLLRNGFWHSRFPRLEAVLFLPMRKHDRGKFGNSTDAA